MAYYNAAFVYSKYEPEIFYEMIQKLTGLQSPLYEYLFLVIIDKLNNGKQRLLLYKFPVFCKIFESHDHAC